MEQRFVEEKLSKFLATCAGIGYVPFAPGTVASLVAVFWVGLLWISPGYQLLSILFVFFVGVWASARTAYFTGHPDPPFVVIDEVCGIFLTFFLVSIDPQSLAFGFIFFRLTDIFKLPFIRRLEIIPNGFGIMLDDMAAGLLSNILLRILLAVLR